MNKAIDLDAILAEGYLAAGVKPAVVAARSQRGAELVQKLAESGALRNKGRKAPAWTEDEESKLRQWLGVLREDEIAERLGRSLIGVHLRWKRIGIPAPSKAPDIFTGRQVARLLNLDEHIVSGWIDSGLLPARRMAGDRKIRLVQRAVLYRWCVDPENWMRFKVQRVQDQKLHGLIQRRMARWGDEWWTTRQVADHHNTHIRSVGLNIHLGKLRAVQIKNMSGRHAKQSWACWFVRKSDAVAHVFHRGYGSGRHRAMAPAALEFMLLARGVGLTYESVGKLCGFEMKAAAYRIGLLEKRGTSVQFVDWHQHRQRLPWLDRTVSKFLSGGSLNRDELNAIAGVLNAWREHHGLSVPTAKGAHLNAARLICIYKSMQAVGVEAF